MTNKVCKYFFISPERVEIVCAIGIFFAVYEDDGEYNR